MSLTVLPTVPAAAVQHPTVCPPWCEEHAADRTETWHWSLQHKLRNPRPEDPNQDVLLRAELYRRDTVDGGETRLLLGGESDVDVSAEEADVLIGQLAAFVDTLRGLRSRMGA